ncbi:Uncharacterised protein [Acinetobacter baumannii]|uniref:hypothetical protein n=1 Tax=Acinetobacter baumannii TaxID=470 RepID=UPI000E19730F|nr:hypothetical protein [Acinetobacter baumannii]SUV62898.1 Uncharacterised protein [Acinetobacter baumannii]
MVTRHGAKKFIISVLPEIEKRLEAGYTIKEIHADLPELEKQYFLQFSFTKFE